SRQKPSLATFGSIPGKPKAPLEAFSGRSNFPIKSLTLSSRTSRKTNPTMSRLIAFSSPRTVAIRTFRQRAFTVIELLVVVAVLAVVSGLGVAGVQAVRKKGDLTQELVAGRNLVAAYQLYAADNNGRLL